LKIKEERCQKSANNHASIVTVGNAIVDVIAKATDQFIAEQGMMKNAMNLIDADRANYAV
jgi:sugar/nucleoside kinase (ribokinase family)